MRHQPDQDALPPTPGLSALLAPCSAHVGVVVERRVARALVALFQQIGSHGGANVAIDMVL
eukprot:354731-Chlamydomonas_euryale.AAC.3